MVCTMRINDGNLSPWLEAQQSSIAGLTTGITIDRAAFKAFERSLRKNPAAARLVRDVLPRCPLSLLAGFVIVVVSAGVEDKLNDFSRKQGESLKKIIRAAARKDKSVRKRASKIVSSAEHAFDTRRKGLAEYCFGAVILKRYLKFRSGAEPTARELAALLKAGLAASGLPMSLQGIDYDLLRRNLKNYEEKNPHPLATGERCANMIELTAASA